MFCPRCGSQNSDSAVFCAYCGTRIDGNDRKEQPIIQESVQKPPGYGVAVASLVFGVIGLALIGPIFSILAIIFGCVAKNQSFKGGQATAGIVLGIIALVLGAIVIAILLI
ncbi:MAG: zinc-ribbon domain-containing protein [Chloroflexi bacterium]|nr:zinc-ribbon domain-containing protein [Chloroflexota bacterium]